MKKRDLADGVSSFRCGECLERLTGPSADLKRVAEEHKATTCRAKDRKPITRSIR